MALGVRGSEGAYERHPRLDSGRLAALYIPPKGFLLLSNYSLIYSVIVLQERNVKYPGGGPEASRISAAARRKLGTLGTLIDNLRNVLESLQCDNL